MIGPYGSPIYVGQTVNAKQRISAHLSKASRCTLKKKLADIARTHPSWKLKDNWMPIRCLREGVPTHLADKYEGYFIVNMENGTPKPGTLHDCEYPLRSNSAQGPNWADYSHLSGQIKEEVEEANRNDTAIRFDFKKDEKFGNPDPSYHDAFASVRCMEALHAAVNGSDDHGDHGDHDDHHSNGIATDGDAAAQQVLELQQKLEAARYELVVQEKCFSLDKVINFALASYKKLLGNDSVDGTEFVKVWNHIKEIMYDYVPNPDNISQVFSHGVVMRIYKEGIAVIGNGDHATRLSPRDAVHMLESVKFNVRHRNSAGGAPPQSFQSMMAWCTFDTRLEEGVGIEKKLQRLYDHQKKQHLNEWQKAEIARRIQEGLARVHAQPDQPQKPNQHTPAS